jgi:hypothetical protein
VFFGSFTIVKNDCIWLFIKPLCFVWRCGFLGECCKLPLHLSSAKLINPNGIFFTVIPMDDIRNQILEWLKAGRDDAQDIVDLPWSIQQVEQNSYVAEHPRMPFSLLLMFSEDFVHLIVPLGLETFSMSKDDKLKVYHTLLMLNDQIHMMKFALSGMNDEVYLRVDLDTKTLGKEEFNDALSALLIGLLSAVSALGLQEAFEQEVFDRIVGMVLERMEKGASREDLMRFLTVKVGMTPDEAKALLDQVFEAKRSLEGGDGDVGYF